LNTQATYSTVRAARASRLNIKSGLCALFLVCLFAFGIGLGALPLVGPDEPRYAEIGREMWATGDWISPRLSGALWLEKPALLYWGQAVSYALFGPNEFAARLPSALGALLSVLGIFMVLRSAGLKRLGFISGLILASFAFWLGFARGATTDMPFSAALCGAFLCGWNWLRPRHHPDDRQRLLSALGCAAFIALAMLAKGLAGILLPVVGLSVFAVQQKLHRELPPPSKRSLGIGAAMLLVFFLVAATWYAPVMWKHGRVFIDEFFIRQHFARFASNRYHHAQPIYFYGFITLIGIFPWTFFGLAAIWRAIKGIAAKGMASRKTAVSAQTPLTDATPADTTLASLQRFTWIWACVIIGFFSLSQAKLPGYILPAFPALAILIACEFEKQWDAKKGGFVVWLSTAFLALAALALETLARKYGATDRGMIYLVALLPLGCAFVGSWALYQRNQMLWLASTVLALPLVAASAGIWVFPGVTERVSMKPLAVRLARDLQPNEKIWYYQVDKMFAPDFYAQGRIVTQGRHGDKSSAYTPSLIAAWLHKNPLTSSLIIITRPAQVNDLRRYPHFAVTPLDSQGKFVALRVKLTWPDEGQSRLK
jgi:4-amino-4-deoxy-L-arabinose transferase-like glycosyltransferase